MLRTATRFARLPTARSLLGNQVRLLSTKKEHPNVETNTVANISNFPPKKVNTIVNFGRQGTSYVIERFGKYVRTEKPGLFFTLPFIERVYAVDTRQIVIDVAKQNAFTSDNVAVSVAAQLYLNVVDVNSACYKVQQPLVAVISQALTAINEQRTAVNDETKVIIDNAIAHINAIDTAAANWRAREFAAGGFGF